MSFGRPLSLSTCPNILTKLYGGVSQITLARTVQLNDLLQLMERYKGYSIRTASVKAGTLLTKLADRDGQHRTTFYTLLPNLTRKSQRPSDPSLPPKNSQKPVISPSVWKGTTLGAVTTEGSGPFPPIKNNDPSIDFYTMYKESAECGMNYVKKYNEDLTTTSIFVRYCRSLPPLISPVLLGRSLLCCQLSICHRRSFKNLPRSER